MNKIGNKDSAIERIAHFVAEFRRMLQRDPEVIVLFSEDYDAIDVNAYKGRYRFIRGPSIVEYTL